MVWELTARLRLGPPKTVTAVNPFSRPELSDFEISICQLQ